MNALFLAQASTLQVFYELAQALREPMKLDKVGFYISASYFYRQFRQQVPDIDSGSYKLVKEWKLWPRAEKKKPDMGKLKLYQEKLGAPNLWGPIVCDRRLLWGEKFTYRLDYKPQFTHEQALSMLEEVLVATERLFDEVKPDFVATFICTTIGDYAGYLIARSRNIPFLDLRPTRIKNYMTYGTSVFEPSELVLRAYEQYRSEPVEDRWTREAKEYLDSVRKQDARYEGIILPSRKTAAEVQSQRISRNPLRLVRSLRRLLEDEYYLRFESPKVDHHVPGVIVPLLYQRFFNPRLARRVHAHLQDKYVTEKELEQLDYAFFPLHTEPEVTLLVYSRPFMNQIEAVRNIAYNLPVGMALVVKEHPAALGKRKLSYYDKLLEIFNVRLADPAMDARTLVKRAKFIATIAGSVGLEALLLGKPVLTLGQTPYEIMPSSMVKRAEKLELLGDTIADLLRNHKHDDEALISYVAAVMRRSVPLNFYTNLLGKGGAYSLPGSSKARVEEIQALAEYTMSSFEAVRGGRVFGYA